ncbi:WecB/TagA/CpsF family glycosyltransferase [Methylobacterium oxalidis]|uniref:Acetyl-mannosamine transferase n=1 Tax=Methylobacterium oxalidis TaxID=944322 RepID=A0A512IXP7_9HYPH|nr:WecB/TagA/CpsF family glycosyltransferase [Methylobacterium oxalidis]GEP02456.1 acetyl-mannosamine transferase [Methylobacterium oxalidis]GJE31971.1 N-acetylglucosaminyldiphosphoundecaprenol N-acetyl-beta-D-mannosaminyltransferase [Methylobacterium oxalidis]GLS67835.1 acetyl-mannosamine transferase [Methylobacterium oxalidis]
MPETGRDATGGMPECRASLRLFGLDFSTGGPDEIIAEAAARSGSAPRLVVTANVDHIVLLSEHAAFRAAYESAAVRTLDGMPLVWFSRLIGRSGARRVTGHDLLTSALSAPADPRARIFLVCPNALVGERLRARLVRRGHAEAGVAVAVPPFGFEDDAAYGRHLAERVRTHGTTLLVMGVGAPKSEIWVHRQGAALGAPVTLAVGDALSVAAGLVPRAPLLMQRTGLEWLFRFLHAPQRLFWRYFVRSWRFLRIAAQDLAESGKAAAPRA